MKGVRQTDESNTHTGSHLDRHAGRADPLYAAAAQAQNERLNAPAGKRNEILITQKKKGEQNDEPYSDSGSALAGCGPFPDASDHPSRQAQSVPQLAGEHLCWRAGLLALCRASAGAPFRTAAK
jgi:hypothetical protein